MRVINSIKHQTILIFVSFGLILSALYASFALIAAFAVEDKVISQLLQLEAEHIQKVYYETGDLPASRLDFVTVYGNRAQIPDFISTEIKQLRKANNIEIFTSTDEHYHFQTIKLSEEKTAYLLAEVSALLAVTNTPNFVQLFIIGLIFSLGLAFLLAYQMANQTVKPLLSLTNAIKHKQPWPDLKFEAQYLGQVLDDALHKLNASLIREKNFTNDLNHELRTPITVLNNIVTLAENRGIKDEDLGQLKSVGAQIQNISEVLLALARAESLDKQQCILLEHIQHATFQCIAAHETEVDIVCSVEPNFRVQANQLLLELLLTNLINNVIAHSIDCCLKISLDNNKLVLKNNYYHAPFANITASGVKGKNSTGFGQGLYLVERIADSMNWLLAIEYSDSEFKVCISF